MTERPLEPGPKLLRALTEECAAFVLDQVDTLAEQPAADADHARDVVAGFRETCPEDGQALSGLLARLAPAIAKSYNTAGPGYLAYIPGGGVYASALADFIACAVNRYVGVARAAPALVQIEASAIAWLAAMMGYPKDARGILTSGGSLSNFSAIVTAREALLPEDFRAGVIYVSEETHYCVVKAARLAGFPRSAVRVLPVDERFRLVPAVLEAAIREDRVRGRVPFLVVASVGTTNTGAIDPVPEIVAVARRHGLWVHADAAYGGFFRLVRGGDELVPGLPDCDSITLDPHKGLFLPYGLGCLLVREGRRLGAAHQETASYLQDLEGAEGANFADLSPELSRDFRGLRLWLPLQLYGLAAFRAQLEEKLELARWAADELRADPLFEVLDDPQLSVVAFRPRGEGPEVEDRGQDLLKRVNARGRVFLSSTRLRGRYVLRICVLSFRTHEDRVRDAVTALREEARALVAGG